LGNRIQAQEILREPRTEGPERPYQIFLPLLARSGGAEPGERIDYAYDDLYRLTTADYSSGEFFHYSYDAFGNRLGQQTHSGGSTYAYDAASRLVDVDGQAYSWDANGQLLDDGRRSYAYDHAGRLVSVRDSDVLYDFTYDGLGDRYQESMDGKTTTFSLGLLAQNPVVLSDGSQSQLYGLGRIGGQGEGGWTYGLPDAPGTTRQQVDVAGELLLTRSYDPFGTLLAEEGEAGVPFGFAGEQTVAGLIFLRARF